MDFQGGRGCKKFAQVFLFVIYAYLFILFNLEYIMCPTDPYVCRACVAKKDSMPAIAIFKTKVHCTFFIVLLYFYVPSHL